MKKIFFRKQQLSPSQEQCCFQYPKQIFHIISARTQPPEKHVYPFTTHPYLKQRTVHTMSGVHTSKRQSQKICKTGHVSQTAILRQETLYSAIFLRTSKRLLTGQAKILRTVILQSRIPADLQYGHQMLYGTPNM